MKILVTAAAADPESRIDPRFGRAACFALYDTETETFSFHDNAQNLHAAQGAGIQAGQNAAALGADWVLTGHCGPKAFRVLQAEGIRIGLGQSGTVSEALERCLAGAVEPAATPDVEGHWA